MIFPEQQVHLIYFSMSDCCGKGGTAMDYTMDDAKRMLRRVAEIMRAGLAEDATDEDKAKMQMLVSNDYRRSMP